VDYLCLRKEKAMLIRKIDKDDDYDKFNQRRIFKKGSELFGEPTRMEVLG
jgi:hypothetical protein